MLRCMKVLGIGLVNAFALLAAIGEIGRFEIPPNLWPTPGSIRGERAERERQSIKVGVGKRGRCDIRHLLMQGAHAVLRMGRDTELGKWGWKLFARKGTRNVAVAAVARKLLVQVWHVLSGNPPEALEPNKSLNLKLKRSALARSRQKAAGGPGPSQNDRRLCDPFSNPANRKKNRRRLKIRLNDYMPGHLREREFEPRISRMKQIPASAFGTLHISVPQTKRSSHQALGPRLCCDVQTATSPGAPPLLLCELRRSKNLKESSGIVRCH